MSTARAGDVAHYGPGLALILATSAATVVAFPPAAWPPLAIAAVCLAAVLLVMRRGARLWALAALVPPLALFVPSEPSFLLVTAASGCLLLAVLPARGSDDDRLDKRLERYPILHQACRILASVRHPGQVAECLGDFFRRFLATEAVWVHLVEGEHLRCAHGAHSDIDDENWDEAIHYVWKDGRPLIHHGPEARRWILPLIGEVGHGRREVFGVVDCEVRDGDETAREICLALADLGGQTLATVSLLERAHAMALHDDLTGLFGRFEFERRLGEQLARARREGRRCGLLFCDLDHLKRVNDRFGHHNGDAVIAQVAEVLRDVFPDDAVVCRFGGEEFAAICADADEDAVRRLACEVLARVRADVKVPGANLECTVSIGWSCSREDDDDESLLGRVDDACYEAKRLGRDREVAKP